MFNFHSDINLLFLKCDEGLTQLVQAQSITKPCSLQNSQETRTLLQYLFIQVTHTAHKHHMDLIKLLQCKALLPKDTESVSAALQTPLASHMKSNISHYPQQMQKQAALLKHVHPVHIKERDLILELPKFLMPFLWGIKGLCLQ